ncbi:MAG TPA: hypothetical protein VLJ39_13405 [Tepidisphaeraceae bacterium]|jgi:uncharacterized protein (DUF433 family)|nr:hypothetical protein [Tepidisphaeraceae bacterium]
MELPDFLQLDADQEVTLKGHRIRVMDVAARYLEGHSAEGIAFDIYPTLDLPLVYKAIGFFLDHETEYRQKIEHNAAELSRQAALPRNSPTVAELRRRMNATRPAEAS